MDIRVSPAKSWLSGFAIAALTGAVALVAPGIANATTLTGDSIEVKYLAPDTSTVYDDLGSFTVPGGSHGDGVYWSATANQITITPYSFGAAFGSAAFNGLEFIDLTKDPGIIGVSLDPSTTIASVTISNVSFTSNSVLVNFQGQTWRGGTQAVFDLTFASSATTPLPATLPLFASGLGMLGLLARRRKRAAAD